MSGGRNFTENWVYCCLSIIIMITLPWPQSMYDSDWPVEVNARVRM